MAGGSVWWQSSALDITIAQLHPALQMVNRLFVEEPAAGVPHLPS